MAKERKERKPYGKRTKPTAKRRDRYQTYSDWYDKYSKTYEMDGPKLSIQAFDRAMERYKKEKVANPARQAAASQRMVSYKQAVGFGKTGRNFTEEQLDTLVEAGYSLPDKFTKEWIKQNASIFIRMIDTLDIGWAEAVSPEEVDS